MKLWKDTSRPFYTDVISRFKSSNADLSQAIEKISTAFFLMNFRLNIFDFGLKFHHVSAPRKTFFSLPVSQLTTGWPGRPGELELFDASKSTCFIHNDCQRTIIQNNYNYRTKWSNETFKREKCSGTHITDWRIISLSDVSTTKAGHGQQWWPTETKNWRQLVNYDW